MRRILITGTGGAAGAYLVEHLGRAGFDVFAADMSEHAPGRFLVPRDRRPCLPAGLAAEFVPSVVELCRRERIDLCIPTVDCELMPIAAARAELESVGTRVLTAPLAALRRCLDKLALARIAATVAPGLRADELTDAFDPATWTFPLIVKPRRGSGGRGVVRVDHASALTAMDRSGALMVQEFAPGLEYSVDVLVTQLGRLVSAVPRLRLKVDSGVAITACTVHDDELETTAGNLASVLGLTGVANLQFRRDGQGRPCLMEINPRFPGTMALTVAAGVDMPVYAVRDLLGLELPRVDGFRDVGMVRTWNDHVVPIEQLLIPERDGLGTELAS